MFQKIKSFLSEGNHAQWCVFFLFALTIFIKCVLFHWECFHSVLLSSLWKEPSDFFAFWLPKLNIAILLASFIYVFPNKWWTVVVALLIDLWCISNIIYLRANELLLSYEAIMMASNLKGFESAVLAYWSWNSTVFLIHTCLYGIIVYFFPQKYFHRNHMSWLFLFVVVCVLRITTQICRFHYANKLGFVMENVLNLDKASYVKNVIPYREVVKGIQEGIHFTGTITRSDDLDNSYFRYHSIIAYLPKIFIAHFAEEKALNDLKKMGKKIELTSIDGINKFFVNQHDYMNSTPCTNLIVFIVESFENWVIEAKDENKQLVMPHMNKYVHQKANMYCNQIKSQVREGVSGDGQMIVNTGILPLQKGSAALLFGTNTFPNWAHLFKRTVTIYPGSGSEWNQDTMTVHYQYKQQINPKQGRWEDDVTMHNLLCWLDTISSFPFACQTITVSTHTPFVSHPTSELSFPEDMPSDLKKYLNCFHFTDSCLGAALRSLEESGITQNTTIVITGDHTIFKQRQLQEYAPYIEKHNLPMSSNRNFVPFIVYSPQITEKIQITDTCYQMDIYPTIMHLIGCEDYYWNGFGVNLLDSVARHNRPISEQEAYRISDLLIRSDYFSIQTK